MNYETILLVQCYPNKSYIFITLFLAPLQHSLAMDRCTALSSAPAAQNPWHSPSQAPRGDTLQPTIKTINSWVGWGLCLGTRHFRYRDHLFQGTDLQGPLEHLGAASLLLAGGKVMRDGAGQSSSCSTEGAECGTSQCWDLDIERLQSK